MKLNLIHPAKLACAFFIFSNGILFHAEAQTSKSAAKAKQNTPARPVKKSKPVQAQNDQKPVETPAAPLKDFNVNTGVLNTPNAVPNYQGIPLKDLFTFEYPAKLTEESNLKGSANSFPVVLVPVKNQSGFVPDLHRIYKDCSAMLGANNDRDLLVFTEPNFPDAFLVRDVKLLRRLYEFPHFQNDSIRFFQFTQAEAISSSKLLYKNRGVKGADYLKKIQTAVDFENQKVPVEKHQQLMMSPEDINK